MKKDWMIRESELDDVQLKVLTATLNKSCIISGCAGSGKSILALLKAQRIQQQYGDDYEVIVYTKALCSYMEAGREQLGLHNRFYYQWEWLHRMGRPKADYIIVDEIQDFSKEEIQEFINAARKNFFFFGDTAQSIYQNIKTTVAVENIPYITNSKNPVKNFEIYYNYRLPINVAKMAFEIAENDGSFSEYESTYKNDDTTKPFLLNYEDKEEQLKAINRLIKNNNLTDVAILVPHNEDAKEIYNKLKQIGSNYEVKFNLNNSRESINYLNFNSTNPKIMTYHSAKGLQFEAVFLPYLEDLDNDNEFNRKAFYVAMTRTYKYLYLLYSNEVPTILDNIDGSLYETSETEDIELL